jgi:hypothetical protein
MLLLSILLLTVAYIIVGTGLIVLIGAPFYIVVHAFHKSLAWGFGCLFVPLVWIFFVLTNWKEMKRPFCIVLGSFLIIMIGGPLAMWSESMWIAAGGAPHTNPPPKVRPKTINRSSQRSLGPPVCPRMSCQMPSPLHPALRPIPCMLANIPPATNSHGPSIPDP